jgi:hypothetical protein
MLPGNPCCGTLKSSVAKAAAALQSKDLGRAGGLDQPSRGKLWTAFLYDSPVLR